MQKKWLILCAAVLALSVCTGCGDWAARMKENWKLAASMETTGSMEFTEPESEATFETDSEARFPAETETRAETTSDTPAEDGTLPAEGILPEGAASPSGGTLPAEDTLSPEELAGFESFLNDVANNGFLCCTYEDVRQADLNEILYNGAGLEQQPLTDGLRQAYEAQAEEISTDTVRLTTSQIDGFLLEKTGYGFSEFQPPSWWTYLEEYDIWMTQHGDTNMMGVVCDSGLRKEDGMVVLSCHIPGFGNDAGGCALTVTLRETENGCQFAKNESDADVFLTEAQSAGNSGQSDASFDPARIAGFSTSADTSAVSDFQIWGDFGTITKEALYGTWYCPADGADTETVLLLSGTGARVYYPLLDLFGDQFYSWEVEDRSASGLCPALKIYFQGTDSGPLAYYIAGLTPEYFWCNSQQSIFYRQ